MHQPGKHRIAVVSTNSRRCRRIAAAASIFYDIVVLGDPIRAPAVLAAQPPDVLLVDAQLPIRGGGIDFLLAVRRSPALAELPAILITGPEGGGRTAAALGEGPVLVVTEPFGRGALVKAVSALINDEVCRRWACLPPVQRSALDGTLAAFNGIAEEIGNGQPVSYGPVEEACRSVVAAINDRQYRVLLDAVRDHDDYTYAHSVRVATLLALFGKTIGLTEDDMLLMASGGLVHDIGKVAISRELLNKPGVLSAAEMEVMRGHVDATTRILKAGTRIPKGVIAIAANHHEKLDGSGYPRGLKAAQLDELARMSAIVDVFSAMTDRRPYKRAMDAQEAFRVIIDSMGRELDTHLLALFRDVLLENPGASLVRDGKAIR